MEQYEELLREADAIYTRIYNLRKASFVPTHIGLGTWGRYEMSDSTKAKIAVLTKARNKVMGKAQRLKKALDAA